jgi:hypothetical protein
MEKESLSAITRFFCASAGAHISVLEKCPTQINKFHSMGVILWITAIMAALSGGYFVQSVFTSSILAIAFGIFWGFAIFSLDRYMITTMDITSNKKKLFLRALPRLLLAVCLGLTVAKPLELKIFEKEIKVQMVVDNKNTQNYMFNTDSTLITTKKRIENLKIEMTSLNNSISQLRNEINQNKNDYYDELNGKKFGIATGKKGEGPEAKRKMGIWNNSKDEYAQFKDEAGIRKIEIMNEIESLTNKINQKEQNFESTLKNNGGPLNQFEALHNLTANKKHLKVINIFISLIFILFEMAPVLVKFFMKKGLYEELLEAQESLDKANLLEEMRFAQHKIEIEYKRKRSHYNGEVIFSEKLRNTIRDKQKEFDEEVVYKHQKNSKESLNNNELVEDKYDELVKRLGFYN